jgi:nucleotide-binding universal stress UspA family protein
VKVDVQRIETRDLDVGNALLSHVANESADLLIMGGYGHSRLREMVLGGVTRTLLHEMTVPVLMSH